MANKEKDPTGEFSSYYGCYIIAMAALVFIGIIAWSGWTLYSQDKAISLITQDEIVVLNAEKISPEVEKALQDRLATFAEAAKTGAPASLDLSIADLNTLIQIAPDSGFGSYREMVRIVESDPTTGRLIADLCLPLKKLKFWEGKMRYLVAKGEFQIATEAEGVDAKLVSVKVPGKEVPEGFVNNLQVWPWIAPYRKQEPLGTLLKAIHSATVTPEGLRLSTVKK
jgi:hypothetical protein